MLAGSSNGCTEPTLRAHKVGLLTGLVRQGLANASPDTLKAGGQVLNVVRFKITDAGRRTLVERRFSECRAMRAGAAANCKRRAKGGSARFTLFRLRSYA
jgi:hypothetical protein